MTAAYDSLAEHYDAGRLGYSNDVYNALLGFGLTQRDHVLDAGCGTGLASKPLIENGFRVTGVDASEAMLAKARSHFPSATWLAGTVEKLPLGDASVDAAICAQTFHHVDRAKAIAELRRVVRPRGVVGIWWKLLMNDDAVKLLRDAVSREMGVEPPPSGLTGGFKEFYGGPLVDQTLRVLPWHVAMPLDEYVRYERSRKAVRDAFGSRAEAYFSELQSRLQEKAGYEKPVLTLGYLQFLYMARTP